MKTQSILSTVLLLLLFSACSNDFDILFPQWSDDGILNQTQPLPPDAKVKMMGVYAVDQGADQFGSTVVLQWNGEYLSVYTGKDGGYFILEGGRLDSIIYLQGSWRHQQSTATGLAHFSMHGNEGGDYLFGDTTGGVPTIRLRGSYGSNLDLPDHPIVFRYVRPIKQELLDRGYYILSRHGSGGGPEDLPATENTVEVTRIIERYGANGLGVDMQLTKDGIPILYHDNGLNLRLTQRGPLTGPVGNYTFAQLQTFVRLIHGERIPSVEEFLDVAVTETNLKFIYLDCKSTVAPGLGTVAALQKAALEKAAAMGRHVKIYIAITSDDILDAFLALPDYQNIPSICELGIDELQQANSLVWSPRFTEGLQNSEVAALHAQGREAVAWTVDEPAFIQAYIHESLFDGLMTQYPMTVAYYYYIQ